MSQRFYVRSFPRHQNGAILIVALIMLLLMTIVGMAAIRGSGMQELMAGNMRDQQIAFQAAETALRAGEDVARKFPLDPPFGVGILQEVTVPSQAAYWSTYPWEGSTPQSLASPISVYLASTAPRYVVEQILTEPVPGAEGKAIGFDSYVAGHADERPIVYRVTTRGVGMSPYSQTVVQSTIRLK